MKEPTCQELLAMTDAELLAWARERHRNPYMGLEGAKVMRHENVKWRAMFGRCGRRDPAGRRG